MVTPGSGAPGRAPAGPAQRARPPSATAPAPLGSASVVGEPVHLAGELRLLGAELLELRGLGLGQPRQVGDRGRPRRSVPPELDRAGHEQRAGEHEDRRRRAAARASSAEPVAARPAAAKACGQPLAPGRRQVLPWDVMSMRFRAYGDGSRLR